MSNEFFEHLFNILHLNCYLNNVLDQNSILLLIAHDFSYFHSIDLKGLTITLCL